MLDWLFLKKTLLEFWFGCLLGWLARAFVQIMISIDVNDFRAKCESILRHSQAGPAALAETLAQIQAWLAG